MKKGEERIIGPFKITKTYSRACLLDLSTEMKIFSVFHHSTQTTLKLFRTARTRQD
jgi:hypothetical protein